MAQWASDIINLDSCLVNLSVNENVSWMNDNF